MGRKFFLFMLAFLLSCSTALGQAEEQKGEPDIFAVVKDDRGETLEGLLHFRPEEITVSSKDNEEKTIPSKYLKSITLEKIKEEDPAGLEPKQGARYSVRLENSQEIYTLRKKYTFSLNTQVGVVTKSIDPEMIQALLSKDPSQAQAVRPDGEPFIQDKSIVFTLEFKF